MANKTARTTISLDKDMMKSAKERAKALKYRKFSQYVATLVENDLKERGKHVIVREESPEYGK